jgi:amidophosphoribosyltransferase
MCGLAGLLLYPAQRSAADWQELREIFTRNLIFNEERGREASGVALVRLDGSYRLFKGPWPASELVQMDEYQHIMSQINQEMVCLLGHARMPTKGSTQHNANNHPIVAGQTIGIHNGIISNDDFLFARYGLPRSGEVDSEIIFRLLDNVNPFSHNGTYSHLVKKRTQLLNGLFATLSIDLRRPTRLLILKKLMPLCLHYEERLNALFFSSRYLFLRKAFGRSVITEALPAGQGFCFEAERLPALAQIPVCAFPIHVSADTAGKHGFQGT